MFNIKAHFQLVEVLPNGNHRTLMISSKFSKCVEGIQKFPNIQNIFSGLMLSVFTSKWYEKERIFEIHTWYENDED